MSLSFTGPRGTAEHRWITYALLCDNVLHHLEKDRTSPRFGALHEAARALGGRVTLSARRFHGELEGAAQLLGRPIAELAISVRTRAVLDRSWPPPAGHEATTAPARDSVSIPWLAPGARTLNDAFGNVVRSLLSITADASDDDVVEVDDT
jgi:hypothetical protein